MAITTLEDFKSYFAITADTYDFRIEKLIPKVEEDYLTIRNIPFDTEIIDDVETIVYPNGADVTAMEMIAFKLSQSNSVKDAGNVIYSETIDSYRVSYGNSMSGSIGGYPKQITGSITRYGDGR